MTITVVTRPPGTLQWPRSKLSAPLSSVWPVTVTSRLSPRDPTGLCHPMPTAQGPSRPLPRTPQRGSAKRPQLYAPVGTVGCSANPVASMQRAVRGLEAAARSEGNGSGLHQAHVPHTLWGLLSKHCPNPTAPRPLAVLQTWPVWVMPAPGAPLSSLPATTRAPTPRPQAPPTSGLLRQPLGACELQCCEGQGTRSAHSRLAPRSRPSSQGFPSTQLPVPTAAGL